MEKTGLGRYGVKQALVALMEVSYIEKIGKSSATKYRQMLSPAQEIANIK